MKKLLFILLITACASDKKIDGVVIVGNLRQIMMDGNTEANFDLQNLKDVKHVYALGAVENLNGEILIWDGEPIISQIKHDSLVSQSTFEANATLLVYAQVSAWIPIELDDEHDLKSIEAKLAALSKRFEIDRPFPFLIKSNVKHLSGHVVQEGKDHQHSHDAGFKIHKQNETVDILGFYSTKHHGVFTHHGTNVHMHFKEATNTSAGHVDNVILNKESVLLIPKKL